MLNGLAYTMRLDNGAAAPAPGAAGLAARAWGGRLWVTGKLWRRIYEVELGGLVEATALADPNYISEALGGTAPAPAAARRAAKAGKKKAAAAPG